MKDIDIIDRLKTLVGRPFYYRIEIETEQCTELNLTDPNYVFQGLIRHHSVTEKEEILALVSRLENLRYLNLRRNKLKALPDSLGRLTLLDFLDIASNDLGK
ncbi:MAG TPA: hypothetical protein VI112_04695, partial [Bacteroidia bacterium]